MATLSLILPAFNEAKRLPRTLQLIKAAIDENVFKDFELTEIIIINDGSKDETLSICNQSAKTLKTLKTLDISPNQGKGNAIHTGLKAALGEWCLIADADSATPWDQFLKIKEPKTPIAMGSRDLPESDVRTKQSWIREHMGKTFNLLVRLITGLPYRDTQCGFKLIHKPSILPFLNELQVKRFAWDVEFLMFARAYHLEIAEVPIAWEHQEESRVNAIKDSSEMLFRVIQMRIRIWLLKLKS